jgi:hypothetical protein
MPDFHDMSKIWYTAVNTASMMEYGRLNVSSIPMSAPNAMKYALSDTDIPTRNSASPEEFSLYDRI